MKIAICDDEQKICDLIKNKIEDALTKACEGLRIRQLFLDDRGTRFENEKNKIQLQDIPVGAAYGMAEAKSPEDLETAISQADQAMYADKRKAKGERQKVSDV